MSYRAWGYLGAGLIGAWLTMPPVAEAQQPAASSRRTTRAPALLSAPAVGQASPLVPDDASPASEVVDSPAQAANRPSSRRQTHADPREPRLAATPSRPAKLTPQPAKRTPEPARPAAPAEQEPHLAKPAPQPEKLAPEPAESIPQPSAVAAQPENESTTREGKWTQWEDGRALWTCEFRGGVRHGKATRFFVEGEGPLFAEAPADGFEAPFEAQAVFVQGKLDGPCTIVDGHQRTLCQLSLKADELDGECVWFYPSGERREVAHYHAGRLEGKRLQYNRDAELVKNEEFLGGRPADTENTFYEDGSKKMRGTYYLAGPLENTHFDWLRGELLTTIVSDYPADVRTGLWTWWHPNGQPQLEGHYEEDVPTGTFTWWYPNGQKQRQGTYADGLQSGKWSWWFASGQKQIEGLYVAGEATDDWQFWAVDGSRIRGDVPTLAVGSPAQKGPTPAPRPQVARQQQPRKNSVR